MTDHHIFEHYQWPNPLYVASHLNSPKATHKMINILTLSITIHGS